MVPSRRSGYIRRHVDTHRRSTTRRFEIRLRADIYTEPDPDPHTLEHFGPLRGMAGTWEGPKGLDRHPTVGGTEADSYVEHYELVPIDPQTNGPQLFYGLRYHTHIVKPGDVETFHDQVGYWLWEQAVGIGDVHPGDPAGPGAPGLGPGRPDDTVFEISAQLGAPLYGILSNPFLDENFRTTDFHMAVRTGPGDTWSYEQETSLVIPGVDRQFPTPTPTRWFGSIHRRRTRSAAG